MKTGRRDWDVSLQLTEDPNGEQTPYDYDITTDWFLLIGHNFTQNEESFTTEESGWLSRNTPQSAEDVDWAMGDEP